jgi:hypothetical protein
MKGWDSIQGWLWFAMRFDVIAIQQSFRSLWNDSAEAKFAITEGKIANVLTVPKPSHLSFVIPPSIFVPGKVECVEERLRPAKKQVTELRFTFRVEAHNLTVEHAAATL